MDAMAIPKEEVSLGLGLGSGSGGDCGAGGFEEIEDKPAIDCTVTIKVEEEELLSLENNSGLAHLQSSTSLVAFSDHQNTSMAEHYIPDEILILILKRLPPTLLIKFLLVSKSWYALITSSNFISSHLLHHQHQSLRRSNNLLFVLESNFRHSIRRFGHTRYRTVVVPPSNPTGTALYFPVGSCNGVVCLYHRTDQTLCLWNPGINKHINLDRVPIRSHPDQDLVLCFGFNSLRNDYKVVAIGYTSSLSPVSIPHEAHVYSVNAGIWRSVEFPACSWDDLSHVSNGVFVDGVMHWIMSRGAFFEPDFEYDYMGVELLEYSASIVTFNLHNEVFRELGLPSGLGDATDPDLCLAVMDNSLTLLNLVGEELEYHVWQMKDYSKEESWAILFKIKLPSMGLLGQDLCDNIDGKSLIVTSSGSLIVYDDEITSSTLVNGDVVPLGGQAFSYAESLVFLDRFCRWSWKILEK